MFAKKNRAVLIFILFLLNFSLWSVQNSKVYHIVGSGENLTLIANKYNVSVQQITAWNNLKNLNLLYVGQKLIMYPGSGDAAMIHLATPVSNWEITKGYRSYGEIKNYGLVCRAAENSPVYAADAGVVMKLGYMRGYGNYILIDHGNGWHTLYSNLRQIDVTAGQNIHRKQELGKLDGEKLFFSLAYQGKPVNPVGYLNYAERN